MMSIQRLKLTGAAIWFSGSRFCRRPRQLSRTVRFRPAIPYPLEIRRDCRLLQSPGPGNVRGQLGGGFWNHLAPLPPLRPPPPLPALAPLLFCSTASSDGGIRPGIGFTRQEEGMFLLFRCACSVFFGCSWDGLSVTGKDGPGILGGAIIGLVALLILGVAVFRVFGRAIVFTVRCTTGLGVLTLPALESSRRSVLSQLPVGDTLRE